MEEAVADSYLYNHYTKAEDERVNKYMKNDEQ